MKDENAANVLVPVDFKLAHAIDVCCKESGVDFVDVVDYSLKFVLDNYISNRNAKYARMTPEEIMEIYPVNHNEANMIVKLAKHNMLAIVDTKENMVTSREVLQKELIGSADRLIEQTAAFNEERKYHGYCPDHFFAPCEEDDCMDDDDECIECGIVSPVKADDAVAILPALSELVKTAHDVNVNIHIVVKDE